MLTTAVFSLVCSQSSYFSLRVSAILVQWILCVWTMRSSFSCCYVSLHFVGAASVPWLCGLWSERCVESCLLPSWSGASCPSLNRVLYPSLSWASSVKMSWPSCPSCHAGYSGYPVFDQPQENCRTSTPEYGTQLLLCCLFPFACWTGLSVGVPWSDSEAQHWHRWEVAVSVAQSLELSRRPVGFCTLPASMLLFSLGLLIGILLIVPFTPHPFGSRYVTCCLEYGVKISVG